MSLIPAFAMVLELFFLTIFLIVLAVVLKTSVLGITSFISNYFDSVLDGRIINLLLEAAYVDRDVFKLECTFSSFEDEIMLIVKKSKRYR